MEIISKTGRKMDAAWKKAISDGKKKLGGGGMSTGAKVGLGAAAVGGALLGKPAIARKLASRATQGALSKALTNPTSLKTVASATSKAKGAVINAADKASRAAPSPEMLKQMMRRESKQRAAKAKILRGGR